MANPPWIVYAPSEIPPNGPLTHPRVTVFNRQDSIIMDSISRTPVEPSVDGPTNFQVLKRDGSRVDLDPETIRGDILRSCDGYPDVDGDQIAEMVISGLHGGVSTRDIDLLSVSTASLLIAEDPQYARVAARLMATYISKEVVNQGIHSFSDSIRASYVQGLINDRTRSFVDSVATELDAAIDPSRDDEFEYFGLQTVYDRYLLKHPHTRLVTETPQYFFMRVACALSRTLEEAVSLYDTLSQLDYLPSSPTLFNAGTVREQMSSCYLLDSPEDDLGAIYDKYKDVALLSKFAGGIGLAYHRVRSKGSLIRGTNGHSKGIVPWLKTLDSSVASVNQGGKRKGACSVYLETWHADIESFLELRDSTGEEARRTHNLNLANWIPDIFMRRVKANGMWSLFDPKDVPNFPDLYGEAFDQAYVAAEKDGLAQKTVKARDLYTRMLRTLSETGNGWMTFKDKSNRACNQTGLPGNVVHLSNLCTEILEVTSNTDSAVCNLASVNLSRHMKGGVFDFDKLAATVRKAVVHLDRVIDLNYYPVPSTSRSNLKWRPVGLGEMGLQDVFFQMEVPFDSPEARALSRDISEHIYFHALTASCDLAELLGAHPTFKDTRAAKGELQFDAWGVTPTLPGWDALRSRIQKVGLRNSLLVAIAPTATIASIAGCYECIEPQMSNLFKRETLSGDFLQVNRYLADSLKKLGKWNATVRAKLKRADGSVQGIREIPAPLKEVYRTVWEIPQRSLIDMAADRGAFIDQGQSLNLFMKEPKMGQLSSMYMYAWEKGLKTTYYLRSLAATKIAKTTVDDSHEESSPKSTDAAAVVCSLENPELCEACM